jgi:hypothetical protein
MPSIDFEGIKAAALHNARSLLPELLPGGKFEGDEYVIKLVQHLDDCDFQTACARLSRATGTAAAKIDPIDAFRARAEARAYLWHAGDIDLRAALYILRQDAERDDIDYGPARQIVGAAFQPYLEAA